MNARRPSVRTKTVLMIDYCFPPLAGPHRTLWYVNHLEEFGWRPIVLTVRWGEHFFRDGSLLERIPEGVNVHRTPSFEPVRFVKSLVTRDGTGNGPGETAGGSGRPWRNWPAWVRNLERWIFFPDRRIGWLPFALAEALSLSRHQRIDLIYSTSSAVTSHLIAYVLKRLWGRPWVADFQDPWSESYVSNFPSLAHQKAGQRLEYAILRDAARITVTTDAIRRILGEKYPAIPQGKVMVIPMGFDPGAFKDIQPLTRPKFTITHLGSLWGSRSPGPFLAALGEWVRTHPQAAQEVEVLLVGNFDAGLLRLTEASLDRYHLRQIVRLKGMVPYRTGLQYLLSSHVLLLVTDTGGCGRNLIPSKLYEYLAAGKPVLALTPEGAAAEVVRATRAGLIVEPDDVAAIRDAIAGLYDRWKERRLAFPLDQSVVRTFAWRELTRQLAAVLDEALLRAPDGAMVRES